MHQSNVEVFRRFHAAWTQGDLEAVFALVDPDVVVRPLHGALFSRGEFRGHDGLVDWYREMTEPWDRFEALVEDACETPDGAVGLVVLAGYRGEERLHARVGSACEMRDGRITTLTGLNAGGVEKEIRRLRGE